MSMLRDLLGLLGLVFLGLGVYLLGGWPWFLIVLGGLFLLAAVAGELFSLFREWLSAR